MQITIKIECQTVDELFSHLSSIKDQVRKECKKRNLIGEDELPDGFQVTDNNCYGTHIMAVGLVLLPLDNG